MRATVSIAIAASLALLAPAAAVADPVALLPDIVEGPPAAVSVAADSSQGGTQFELIFASVAENVGDGPLALHGERSSSGVPDMTVTQLVSNSDGSTTPLGVAGTMQYVYSPTHNHFHYLGFEHYELRRPSDGALAGIDHKTGFCLGDVNQVWAAPPSRQFASQDWCQQNKPTALTVDMGITNGWEDIYSPLKEGQYIIVNGVPAGDYYLVNRANEDQSLLEKNYANDASSALVRLSWPGGPNSLPSVSVLRTCMRSETCPAPAPGTGEATGVGPTSATLNGTLNPNGNLTTFAFDYGQTAAYGATTPSQGIGSGASPLAVSADLSALQPNSTYHFRLTAASDGDVFAGADRTFTTPPLPSAPVLPQSPIQPPARSLLVVRGLRALSRGRAAIRVTLPNAGAALLRATVRRLGAGVETVGSGRGDTRASGTITVYLRPTRAGLALLRTRSRLPVNLQVTFAPAGGARSIVHLRLMLRR